ncbi:c-type cytochrome [Aureibaculum sp. A20]|uniref:C-type cytochrome n=1 Tax=Aureibaculum flavum TaxID=2795986 RepID=A0ABS0WWI8_9FLAO|nr:c-type cytochrome [Aureibaculum flavum]MBJ2176256.1 c-type cytochrome [Aureibaculum flavum]
MKFLSCLVFCLVLLSCKPVFEEPVIALDDYKIEEGFTLELVASEPLLDAPVAIDFDNKGRIWVVDMPGFMNGETDPIASIKILEDLDNDGVADHAKIVLDSLVMPRALALVYGGLLYAEPPNLWFAEIENDQLKNKILVDSLYAPDGNPEHQPNGLIMNIDNWIYSAKSNFRYQKKHGKWIKEPTSFRGQWGITKDDFGRLYFNDNSRQLLGDYVLPNLLIRNKFYTPKEGLNKVLTDNQRVYPLYPTPVNRGYVKGVLDKDSLLVHFTAACGPLVYRGNNFSDNYNQNVFVCEPAANLVKRNILTFNGVYTEANQAYQDKEFLASTDEGFRPVNLSNGPDGNMYIVDMHRGVIQHHVYLSPYLKKKSKEEKLDSLVDFGRILKVSKTGVKNKILPDLNGLSNEALVNLLKSENGWLRDRAQQLIILKGDKRIINLLNELVQEVQSPLAQLHAMYALQGLDALSFEALVDIAKNGNSEVGAHAVILLEDYVTKENTNAVSLVFKELIGKNSITIDFYLSAVIGNWATLNKEAFLPFIEMLSAKYKNHKIFQEVLVSGFSDATVDLQEELIEKENIKNTLLAEVLTKNIKQFENKKPNVLYVKIGPTKDARTNGANLYRQICAACHSSGGEGIEGLAPPLLDSEYLKSSMEKLGLVLLHGLEGPVTIHNTVYNFNGTMPGLIDNTNISDNDLHDIINYITSAFTKKPSSLSLEKIKELRNQKSKSGSEFTEAELNAIFR